MSQRFQVQVLIALVILLSILNVVLLLRDGSGELPDRIRVRRIDLVDEAGVARLTLAAPLPNPQVQGVEYDRSAPAYGIMLRDSDGNEMGGIGVLDFQGRRAALIAFDHPTAEAVGFNLIDKRPQFLMMQAPPEGAQVGETGPVRLKMGLEESGEPSLELADAEGRTRLRLRVDAKGQPHVEYLNEAGDVVNERE